MEGTKTTITTIEFLNCDCGCSPLRRFLRYFSFVHFRLRDRCWCFFSDPHNIISNINDNNIINNNNNDRNNRDQIQQNQQKKQQHRRQKIRTEYTIR